MEIRGLNAQDAGRYLNIRLEALQKNAEAFASSYEEEKDYSADIYIERFQSPKNAFTFGAFDHSELVGVVTLVREEKIKLSHRANIVAMYVKPDHRGSGVGKALVTAAIKKAKKMSGVEQVYLAVVTTNDPAKRLYTSMGFEIFGKEKRALKIGDVYYDEEHMVLFL